MTETALIPITSDLPQIFEKTRSVISSAASVDQVMHILVGVAGLSAAAHRAKDKETEAEAAVLTFEAERKLGQLMQAQKETYGFNKGGAEKGVGRRGNAGSEKTRITLTEAGIDKNLGHRARTKAAMSEDEFKKACEAVRQKKLSLTPRSPWCPPRRSKPASRKRRRQTRKAPLSRPIPPDQEGAGEPAAGMASTEPGGSIETMSRDAHAAAAHAAEALADQQDGASEPAKQSGRKRKPPAEALTEHIRLSAASVSSGVKSLASLKEAKGPEYVNQVFEHLINDEFLIEALVEIARHPMAGAIVAAVVAKLGDTDLKERIAELAAAQSTNETTTAASTLSKLLSFGRLEVNDLISAQHDPLEVMELVKTLNDTVTEIKRRKKATAALPANSESV